MTPDATPRDKVNLERAFASFDDAWKPRIAAALNGQEVKLVKLRGAFEWHHHDDEDELFLVVRGSLRMEMRGRTVVLKAGELMVVPRGVEHRPVADEETHVLLFEPAGTVNTGNLRNERTAEPQPLD